ncbi:MAG: 3'-5' exonuclease [Candidatus Altiarchaeales archaeon HGW-Altiarchaeales-1]|nr:MAG: 3'-5' exonuclease [Candidatus Altiarchaeales archaeon HGW-Altiarchaeales-1]
MNYIIIDLEATCDDKVKNMVHEIIEIGAVKINENGEIIDAFDEFVKPIINPTLSEFCKNLTQINQSQTDKAENFLTVIEKFKRWLNDDYFLCSWGHYDRKQLINDCSLHNLDSKWTERHISIKHEYAKINKCKPCGMSKALEKEHITLTGTHHRGIDDAKNIAKIFIKYFEVFKKIINEQVSQNKEI